MPTTSVLSMLYQGAIKALLGAIKALLMHLPNTGVLAMLYCIHSGEMTRGPLSTRFWREPLY